MPAGPGPPTFAGPSRSGCLSGRQAGQHCGVEGANQKGDPAAHDHGHAESSSEIIGEVGQGTRVTAGGGLI